MCVQLRQDVNAASFSSFLLKVGEGKIPFAEGRSMEPDWSSRDSKDSWSKSKSQQGNAKVKRCWFPAFHYYTMIPLFPSDEELGFTFRRLQFSIKICFSLTNNKLQGPTLKRIGLHLKNSFFSPDQCYVGMPRVGSINDLFVLPQEESLITNVVQGNLILKMYFSIDVQYLFCEST